MSDFFPTELPPLDLPTIEEIRATRERISSRVIRSPLVRLCADDLTEAWPGLEIFLKLENLQRTGSFELRCAAGVLTAMDEGQLSKGVLTASSGNFAQVSFSSWCIIFREGERGKLKTKKRTKEEEIKKKGRRSGWDAEKNFERKSHTAGFAPATVAHAPGKNESHGW